MLILTAVEDPASASNLGVQLLIIVILTLINAFLASSELAILSANQYKIDSLAEQKNKKAILVQKLRENETTFLSTIQVGITLAGFFSSATAAVSLSEGMAKTLQGWNIPFASQIALVVVTLILSYFTLVFGELFPKRIALRSPEKIALLFARPINIIRIIFKPIVWLLSGSCELLVKIFRLKPKNDNKVTEDEVIALVSSAVDSGTIDEDEKEIINAVFTFGDLKIRDVMTPRINVFMLDIDYSANKIKSLIKEEKYTRIPVYKEYKDQIIGILNIKDLIWSLKSNFNNEDLISVLRKPLFVNENMNADTLFKMMQKSKNHSAVVIDEMGSVSGYVTMEDLIEEIMGDIEDEFDEAIELVKKIDDKTYLIEAIIPLQDLNRQLDIDLKGENDYFSTLAGFVTNKLEGFPSVDSEIVLEEEGISLKVVEMDNTRIKTIKMEIISK